MVTITEYKDGTILASDIRSVGNVSNSFKFILKVSVSKAKNISAVIEWVEILESPYETENPKVIKTIYGGTEKFRYEFIKNWGSSEEAKKVISEVKSETIRAYEDHLMVEAQKKRKTEALERAENFKKDLKKLLKKYQFELRMTTEPTCKYDEIDGCIADLFLEDRKYVEAINH